jgi:hypothetical protein
LKPHGFYSATTFAYLYEKNIVLPSDHLSV